MKWVEGIFVGYRGYDEYDIEPLYPFGYGLSYTTFEYDGLSATPDATSDGPVIVSLEVSNSGKRPGADVAQLYVADTHNDIARPPGELKGFANFTQGVYFPYASAIQWGRRHRRPRTAGSSARTRARASLPAADVFAQTAFAIVRPLLIPR